MSGHSKWHNIQERKGKQDARRSGEFTKAAKAITIAAQKGGDPAMNFSLRLAIDKAKAVGMPKDNIERAIKRGTGEIAGERMEEMLYEAYGPGGVAILIQCVTDNKNRTLSEIKHILSVCGGSFGSAGSVQWMFEHAGLILVSKQAAPNKDELELALIEAGAEDFVENENEIEIKCKPQNLHNITEQLKKMQIEPKEAHIRWVAKNMVAVTPEVSDKLTHLFGELEAQDDVEDYFTNAE